MSTTGAHPPVLSVRNLTTVFETDEGPLTAVNDVSFDLAPGRILGVVGESGSGKTQLSLSIMRLLAEAGEIAGGEIHFDGRELTGLPERAIRRLRGNDIAMIFQEPQSSFDPIYTIGNQISESLRIHEGLSRRAARDRAVELLSRVGIPHPEQAVNAYPHSLSGGMRQRAMIAGALACGPKLLIADEPTTALDVTIQAQVLTLLRDLQARLGTAVVFITHDLGVIAEIAEEVMVMYAGHVVERTSVAALFDAPQHPYSRALVESRPVVGARRLDRLPAIPGQVPSLTDRPSGCPFHPRCPHVMDRCRTTLPGRYDAGESTDVLCWLYTDGGGARGED